MRVLSLACLLALAALSSGCLVLTLQPVYDDGSLDVDETLTGTWQGPEQGATVVVERGEWKSYRLTYTARNTSYVLVAYLTTIGDARFLDLTPAHGLEAGPLMLPVHGVCRLQHEGDTLILAPLDYDWFVAAARAKTESNSSPTSMVSRTSRPRMRFASPSRGPAPGDLWPQMHAE